MRNSLTVGLAAAVDRIEKRERNFTLTVDGHPYFVHGIHPPLELVVVGAVHIAQPLAVMARMQGYDVTVIDPRCDFATPIRFPDVGLIEAWPREAFSRLKLHRRCAVVALSHDPQLDDPALTAALESEAF